MRRADQEIGSAECGFTLLEVIFAISILTIGILAVATMQLSSIRGNDFARSVTEVSTWAGDQLEKLLALPYNDASLNDSDGDGAAGLNDATAATADYGPVTQGKYTVFWNVAVDHVASNTKTITVIVTWTDRGVQRSVSMQHIRAGVI
jgi:prepilin-type N-terminal cleavage/methylation domain-containing protein